MGKFDSLFDVNISLASVSVQQKGFGRPLIIGNSNRMGSDLFRVYTSTAGMVSDGFLITDPEYIAASKVFSQPIAPPDIMVGYTPTDAVAQVEVIKVATATNDFSYVVTVNGESATFLSDSSATAAEIVTGLIAAINALSGAAAWTAAALTGYTDRFKITSDVAGTPITVVLGTTKLTKKQFESIKVNTVTDAFEYTMTVNGQTASYTSGTGATAAQIRDGLMTALAAFLPGMSITATSVSTDTVSLEAPDEATNFVISMGTTKLVMTGSTLNAAGGAANGLTAIVAAGGKSWYGLVMTQSKLKADILDAAAWIEAQTYAYIFIGCSDDSDVLTTATDDIASTLKGLSYLRTAFFWHDAPATMPPAAWLGEEFPKQPGSSNYAWKTLAGIAATADTVLTDSKIANADTKNANYYIVVGGVPVTLMGKMAGGQWIDVVVGRDWIKANMQQDLLSLQVTKPKIGFNDAGIGDLANVLRSVLDRSVTFGIIDSYTITVPKASDFTSDQRNTRILPSIPWTAKLTGAINGLVVNGNLVP